MAYSNFPTLSRDASRQGFIEDVDTDEPTLEFKSDAGIVFTKPKSTVVAGVWEVTMEHVSTADMETFKTFERTTVRFGALPFNWTHPVSSTGYVVKFVKKSSIQSEGDPLRWTISYKVREAFPTSS